LVSVSLTAFNAENWLPRALDSALNQRTDFPYEIVVADDCSTDTTLRIAHSYRKKHSNVVRVLERSKNLGVQRNTYETFEQCRGKYIAWLDSDDYWTDPEKLAIQAKTMESDPTISACGHLVRWVTKDGEINRDIFPSTSPGRYGLDEIIRHNFLPSPSVMFRNGVHRDLPTWYFELDSLSDWPVHVMSGLTGDLVLLDRVMADYMLTPGSAFMSKGALYWYKEDARFYEKIESIVPSRWQRLVRAEKGKRYESIAYLLREQGNFVGSREAAFKAFRSHSLTDNIGSKAKSLLAACVRETQWRLRGGQTASPGR
jgi:glycosyltransferase involved in cell wall biosynthesis